MVRCFEGSDDHLRRWVRSGARPTHPGRLLTCSIGDDTNGRSIASRCSRDGVRINVPSGLPRNPMMRIWPNKFTVVDLSLRSANSRASASRIWTMMPSSRAEVWVAIRNANAGKSVRRRARRDGGHSRREVSIYVRPGEAWLLKLARSSHHRHGQDDDRFRRPAVDRASARFRGLANRKPASCAESRGVGSRSTAEDFLWDGGSEHRGTANSLGYEAIDQNGAWSPERKAPSRPLIPTNSVVCLPAEPGSEHVARTWEWESRTRNP